MIPFQPFLSTLMAAQAAIHERLKVFTWIPAYAGMRGLGVCLFLAGCATGQQWQVPPMFQTNSQPVVAACPPQVIGQARWVQSNLARLRLGRPRKDALGIVGLPAHVESFLLADNSAVDVLYYHTPETACRPVAGAGGTPNMGLIPLVFQNDRLLGYGQGYYHQMVVPNLRQPLGLPVDRVVPEMPMPTPRSGASVGRGQPLQ